MIDKHCSNSIATGKQNWKRFVVGTALLGSLAGASTSYGGQTFQLGDDKSLSLGFGLRSSFTGVENGAPDGTPRSKTFSIDDMRLYMTGPAISTR